MKANYDHEFTSGNGPEQFCIKCMRYAAVRSTCPIGEDAPATAPSGSDLDWTWRLLEYGLSPNLAEAWRALDEVVREQDPPKVVRAAAKLGGFREGLRALGGLGDQQASGAAEILVRHLVDAGLDDETSPFAVRLYSFLVYGPSEG